MNTIPHSTTSASQPKLIMHSAMKLSGFNTEPN